MRSNEKFGEKCPRATERASAPLPKYRHEDCKHLYRDSARCLHLEEFVLAEMAENANVSESGELASKSPETLKQKVHKRAPSTPLTPSTAQQNITRRKLAPQPSRYLEFESPTVLECQYQNWLLGQQLTYNQDLVAFMEMERKFEQEG